MLHQLKEAAVILMEFVHGEFVLYPQIYQQRARYARRETNKVDKERGFEPFEIPEDQYKIVSKHVSNLDSISAE
jgi:hypothetical protein